VTSAFAVSKDAEQERAGRQALVAVLARRRCQLEWTQEGDPVSDLLEAIERARCTGPDLRLSPAGALGVTHARAGRNW
jgi:hypothetical protein